MRRKIKTHIARTLAILGLIILAFAAFPEMPNAEDAWVSLGGVMLKSDNVEHRFNDSGMSVPGWSAGSYKLSTDSSTLYINGLTFSSSDDGVDAIVSNHSLNIIATGTNTITCSGIGIYLYSNGSESLTLSSGGSSKAIIKVTSSNDTAIVTPDNCTITNVDLNATGDYSGISIGKDLNMNSGSINASSLVLDAFNIRDGQINVQNEIVAYKTSLISGGSVTAQGNASLYGLELQGGTVTIRGNLDFFGSFTQTRGTVQSDGDVIIRVGGYNGKDGSFTSGKGITIVNGDMLIYGADVRAQNGEVNIYGDLMISGGSLAVTSDTNALYAKKVTISDGTLTMDGNTWLWYGFSNLDLANDIWLSEPSDGMIGDSSDSYTIRAKDGSVASHAVLRKVSSISVKNPPNSNLYEGDCFDPAGLVLNVNFTGGSTASLTYNDAHKDMFGFSISPRTELSFGDKQQTISCLGKRAFLNFTVKKIGKPQLSGSVSGKSALLNWTVADGAHQYIVFVGETGSGSSRRVGTLTGTSFTHEGLEPGRSYDYTVYPSRNSNNGSETWGEQSNTLTLVVPLDTPQLTASAEGCDAASLSWNAVDGASGYVVYRQEGSGSFTEIKTTEDTSLEDTGLDTGTEYTYYVKAKRGSVVSTESNYATVTPTFTGSTTLTVSNNNPGYYLAWDAVNGATSYEIWRGGGENGEQSHIADIDTNAYTDSSADSYSTYNYMVKPNRIVGGNTFYADNSNVAIGEALERPHEPEPETKPDPVIVPPPQDDPSGTVFGLLQARSTKVTKTSITIAWKKVEGAQNYVIYGNKCGTNNKYKKLTATTNLSLTFTNVAGNKLKKGTYYKFLVYAVDGKGKILSTSKTVHVATTGGKVGNDKAVRTAAKKNKVTLKIGKSFKLKAKPVPKSKKLKVKRHRKIAYETSNSNIATVSKKGVIKAKDKGVCYVYAYTQNGIFAKVKVTVK